MKRKIMALLLIVSFVVPMIIAGCDDEVEVQRERNLAPRTVQQKEVVAP